MSFSIHLDQLRHDFRIKGGRLVLSRGADSVRDRIKVILWRYLGDWYLNTSQGLPMYDGEILGSTTEVDMASAYIRRDILADPDVIRIERFEISRSSTRGYTISASVQVRGPEYSGSTIISVEV